VIGAAGLVWIVSGSCGENRLEASREGRQGKS
jgi:hypothetical protein